jgi:hypothetical protein
MVDTGIMEENAIKWSAKTFHDFLPHIHVCYVWNLYGNSTRGCNKAHLLFFMSWHSSNIGSSEISVLATTASYF